MQLPKSLIDRECKLWGMLSSTSPLPDGKIVSLDKLEELLPKNEHHSKAEILYDKEKYIIYGINEKKGMGTLPRRVAYQCKKCKVIVLGSPNIKSILGKSPLKGKFGYSVSCRQCDTLLEENVIEVD